MIHRPWSPMTPVLGRVNYCLIVNITFIRPHPMVPTMLLLIDYIVYLEGFIGSTFAFYEQWFWKEWFFPWIISLRSVSFFNSYKILYSAIMTEVPYLYENKDYYSDLTCTNKYCAHKCLFASFLIYYCLRM